MSQCRIIPLCLNGNTKTESSENAPSFIARLFHFCALFAGRNERITIHGAEPVQILGINYEKMPRIQRADYCLRYLLQLQQRHGDKPNTSHHSGACTEAVDVVGSLALSCTINKQHLIQGGSLGTASARVVTIVFPFQVGKALLNWRAAKISLRLTAFQAQTT